jgi:hypothetical protein
VAELSREEIKRLARLGAQRRLQELRQEEAALRATLPDLEETGAAGGGRGRSRKAQGSARTAPAKRRRRKMSAAARKAVSDRMKKYWASRRKANG